ncbi:MAG TPA: hypothetical protein QF549_02525 [Candidatus Saccharimonadaceae bacterium]|nr:hypothetical protein [Candidatus Saccharimonadaceae bacterium]
MASPQSTLPQNDEDQDRLYNPSQKGSRSRELLDAEKADSSVQSGIDQAEAFANDPKNASEAVKAGEEEPKIPGKEGLYRRSGNSARGKVKLTGSLKKRGPIFALVSLVVGAGLGLSAFFSPSLLIIHMKEIMFDKFNTQIVGAEARSRALLGTKNQSTSGLCGARVTISCRFSTMSETQVDNFRKAGITVQPETPNAGSRTKPTGYVYKGEVIRAADFARVSQTDPSFRSALRLAYNPRFAGFWGSAWNRTGQLLGIDKSRVDVSGADKNARMAKLNNIAKNPATNGGSRVAADFENDNDCNASCAQEKANEANGKASTIEEDGRSGDAARRASAALSGAPLESIGNVAKVTGVVDSYCMAYTTIKAIGYAGKTIRAVQLARYAMAFFKVADEIKATGDVSPETVAFMGGILTEVTYDVGSTARSIVRGSATDAFGYKFAAFGDTTGPTRSMNIANRFIAGGGFAGELQNFSNGVLDFFPGGRSEARSTCGFLANPAVQVGSIILGVGTLAIPGVNVARVALSAAGSGVVALGLAMLPTLLADIVAGTVTDNIAGEESGNAIPSGAGKILSDTLPGQSGNAVMSKEDALAFYGVRDQTLAQYAEDDRDNLSPLDISSRHTFLGSIVSQLTPVMTGINSPGSLLSATGSLFATSLSSITPKTKALTRAESEAALNFCTDPDVVEGGYATDPFCNVVRGIPPQYLNKDPLAVIDDLTARGYLDTNLGNPTPEYQEFIDKCITTSDPPGYDGETMDFSPSRLNECMINENNANLYVHFMDRTYQQTMDEVPGEQIVTDGGDKQELAQKIIEKGKVNYFKVNGVDVRPTLEEIADGSVDPDSLECGININILKAIDAITDKHTISISSLNRLCTNYIPPGSFAGSRHSAGNGSALDIAIIDGVATTGRDSRARSIIEIVMPILSEAATSTNGKSQIGQLDCGSVPLMPGVVQIRDPCHHLHFDVPPVSDPNLEYTVNGTPTGGPGRIQTL